MKKQIAILTLGAFMLTGSAVYAKPIKSAVPPQGKSLINQIQKDKLSKGELRNFIDYLVKYYNQKYPNEQITVVANPTKPETKILKTLGTITEITKEADYLKVTLEGKGYDGGYDQIILNVNNDTKITNTQGKNVSTDNLTKGMTIVGYYKNKVSKSLPPIATAKHIVIKAATPQKEITFKTAGTITAVDEEHTSFTVKGIGIAGGLEEIKFYITKDTPIYSPTGEKLKYEDLVEGAGIIVEYGDKMTMSLPPIVTVKKIILSKSEISIPESIGTFGFITDVQKQDAQLRIKVTGTKIGTGYEEIILNISETTKIEDPKGNSLKINKLEKGKLISAFASPIVTRSLPPIGNATKVIIY